MRDKSMTTPVSTIAAIATPPGTGGIGIVRLSGPQAWPLAADLLANNRPFEAGRVCHGWVHASDGSVIDEVIVLPFRGPKSFTGEDVIEIHGHGGEAVMRAILGRCLEVGAEPAEAGEFTRRAFLNGRIDLTQAEAVADLIHARAEAMVRHAAGNLRYRTIGQAIDVLYDSVRNVLGEITAAIDFPDEMDEPDPANLQARLLPISQQLEALAATARTHKLWQEGLRLALLGQPNAGKSSLFNALLNQNRAIVTDIAGTTRDVLTESLALAGLPVTLADTAGLRLETSDTIEQEGILRSWAEGEHADGVLYVIDASQPQSLHDEAHLARLVADQGQQNHIAVVLNKSDIAKASQEPELAQLPVFRVSAKTSEGLPALLAWLNDWAQAQAGQAGLAQDTAIALNERQQALVLEAKARVDEAIASLGEHGLPIDVVSVPLSAALAALNTLQGRDVTEDLLGDIFSRFCIGK